MRALIRPLATLLVLVPGVLTLAGCAPSRSLTKQSREATRSVSVNNIVPTPGDLVYIGQGQAVAGTLLGPVGAAIAAAADQGPKGQLKVAMQLSTIDVGRIVREQFAADLAAAGVFPAIVAEGADAEIKLEMRMYGFVHAPFSTALKPVLGVRGTLTRKDGTVLWETYDQVWTANKETPAHALAEYLQTTELIREAFSVASRVVVGGLVKHMRE